MNDDTTNLDQADEDILTPTLSDEALEAATGIGATLNYLCTYGGCGDLDS
jgi:hypothetical protein